MAHFPSLPEALANAYLVYAEKLARWAAEQESNEAGR